MAEILNEISTAFVTDFAIVGGNQELAMGGEPGGFAGSLPGSVAGLCGTKYASVSARAELWNARPPFDNSWEDIDELAFSPIVGAGTFRLSGFDAPDDDTDDGLDLDGLGAGRVLVMARGRQRYDYAFDGDTQALGPEEWLFQFFPESGGVRPLAGAPRRLAGSAPYGTGTATGMASALSVWERTGWDHVLRSSPGHAAVRGVLYAVGHPVSAKEIAENWVLRTKPTNSVDPLDAPVGVPARGNDPLADLTGLHTETIGQAIDALRKLELLIPIQRDDEVVLVPNPVPGLVWDRVELSASNVIATRQQIGYASFGSVAQDIRNALGWADASGLRTTVREMALRWSTSTADVRGGLALLESLGELSPSPSIQTEGTDDAELLLIGRPT
jgi:hypothetical protein